MNEIVKYEQVKDKILTLRGQQVILDCDVAKLYGVETKRVNEAVKNNPEKFPSGWTYSLTNQEIAEVRSKFSTSSLAKRQRLNTKLQKKRKLNKTTYSLKLT